ncbi:MAG: tRNA pseudouridine(38-40) synthase TruA [Polyangiaceae bacterium]|nr:tRNA pseudouridine(38-40) synthase TruA [Polyangiaceae bacterium]
MAAEDDEERTPVAEARGVLLSVAYDGRPFSGYAMQRDRRTVAGELLGALRHIDASIPEVRGASRTDAGVHAKDQRVGFDPSKDFPLTAWTHGAQKHLPEEISIKSAVYVERGFSPRHHAIAKTYRYTLLADDSRDPFFAGRAWRVPELATERARRLLELEGETARGTHDFAAFRNAADQRESTVRTLFSVTVRSALDDPRLVFVDVRGNGFLYNMVRILVGTIVDVARGRLQPGAVARALASKDRRDAGITAPPDGLVLERYEIQGMDDQSV